VAKAEAAVLNYEVVKSGEVSEDKSFTIIVKSLANYPSVASGAAEFVIAVSNVVVYAVISPDIVVVDAEISAASVFYIFVKFNEFKDVFLI